MKLTDGEMASGDFEDREYAKWANENGQGSTEAASYLFAIVSSAEIAIVWVPARVSKKIFPSRVSQFSFSSKLDLRREPSW